MITIRSKSEQGKGWGKAVSEKDAKDKKALN